MTDADERLLVEAARRNPSHFAELYERHFEHVYAYVVHRVRDRTTAEDLTAEVFHKALAGLPRYEWRGAPFGAWLIRIAANAIADRSKRAGREVASASPPDRRVEPDVNLDEIERSAQLFRLVNELPDEQRRVILERYVEERSIREIAARLDRSEGAIKQLRQRALQTLRSRMEAAHA